MRTRATSFITSLRAPRELPYRINSDGMASRDAKEVLLPRESRGVRSPRSMKAHFLGSVFLFYLGMIILFLATSHFIVQEFASWNSKISLSFGLAQKNARSISISVDMSTSQRHHFPPWTAHMHTNLQPTLFMRPTPTLSRIAHFMEPDYGELHMLSLQGVSNEWQRAVEEHADDLAELHRGKILDQADELYVGSRHGHYEDLDWPRECVKPAWSYLVRPTCNAFHEKPLEHNSESIVSYLAHGYYRDTWQFESSDTSSDRMVLKRLRFKHEYNARMVHKILNEAIVMEATTASPVTTSIFGHCATSLLVEMASEITYDIVPYKPSRQIERGRVSLDTMRELEEPKNEPYSFNKFTVLEKLEIALQMAEGLAEMHGFTGGVIVNDDAHPDQWLVTDDNRVVLNDMNNAVILEWNDQTQEYCQFYTSYGGDFRAPEEYLDDGAYVDESVDVWPMGNLIFTLLTGLWPYYSLTDSKVIQNVTMTGKRPYLHPAYRNRSLIERRMTEIMDMCHVLEPADRVDIFTVLEHLQETKRLHERQEKQATVPSY